jgi:hypothetical protein
MSKAMAKTGILGSWWLSNWLSNFSRASGWLGAKAENPLISLVPGAGLEPARRLPSRGLSFKGSENYP